MANPTHPNYRPAVDTDRDPRIGDANRNSGSWYYVAALVVLLALGYWAFSSYSTSPTVNPPVTQSTTDQNNTNAAPPPADTGNNVGSSTMAPADPGKTAAPAPVAPAAQ